MPKTIDITGKTFGKLTIICLTRLNGRVAWRCRCECGNETTAYGHNLRSGRTKTCGCGEHAIKKDLTGEKFGRWTVLGHAGKKASRSSWHVVCDCGTKAIKRGDLLTTGSSKSCGCFNVDSHKTHGMKYTTEYKIWQGMKNRCLNPKSREYHRYGATGIGVAQEWVDDFMAFYEHIGPRPSTDYSVDRINPFGNYEPGNVRWATRSEQQRNRRDTKMLYFRGETKSLVDWCDELRLPVETMRHRIFNMRWSVERALTEPIG